jgi:hypothetical protein
VKETTASQALGDFYRAVSVAVSRDDKTPGAISQVPPLEGALWKAVGWYQGNQLSRVSIEYKSDPSHFCTARHCARRYKVFKFTGSTRPQQGSY